MFFFEVLQIRNENTNSEISCSHLVIHDHKISCRSVLMSHKKSKLLIYFPKSGLLVIIKTTSIKRFVLSEILDEKPAMRLFIYLCVYLYICVYFVFIA